MIDATLVSSITRSVKSAFVTGKDQFLAPAHQTPLEIVVAKLDTQESSAPNAKKAIMGSQHAARVTALCSMAL